VSDGHPLRIRRRLLVVSLAVAVAFIAIVAVVNRNSADDRTGPAFDDDLVLDTPGEFTEPGISTNAPVRGEPLPDVVISTVGGDPFATSGLVGAPLVVNVWFSTCPPCRRELPAFAAVHARYGEEVRFVGINPRDDGEAAIAFARERGVAFETLLDPDGEFLAAAGIGTFPSTLLVAADGTIVVQRAGEISEEELEHLVTAELLR
jgi:thiol-disulfide isomerase/thioredoxin